MPVTQLLVSYPVFIPSQALLSVFQFSGLDSGPSAYTFRGAHPPRCNTPVSSSSASFLRAGNTTSKNQGGLTTGGLRGTSHLIHRRQTLPPHSPKACSSAGEDRDKEGSWPLVQQRGWKRGPAMGNNTSSLVVESSLHTSRHAECSPEPSHFLTTTLGEVQIRQRWGLGDGIWSLISERGAD